MRSKTAAEVLQEAQARYRADAEREAAVDGLTPAGLDASAEFDPDHELVVRSVAPAVVIVLEREAPVRYEVLAATRGEGLALREWIDASPEAGYVWGAYLETVWAAAADDEVLAPDLSRANAHTARLDVARRIETPRVGET